MAIAIREVHMGIPIRDGARSATSDDARHEKCPIVVLHVRRRRERWGAPERHMGDADAVLTVRCYGMVSRAHSAGTVRPAECVLAVDTERLRGGGQVHQVCALQ
jgi:hypothetical protein